MGRGVSGALQAQRAPWWWWEGSDDSRGSDTSEIISLVARPKTTSAPDAKTHLEIPVRPREESLWAVAGPTAWSSAALLKGALGLSLRYSRREWDPARKTPAGNLPEVPISA